MAAFPLGEPPPLIAPAVTDSRAVFAARGITRAQEPAVALHVHPVGTSPARDNASAPLAQLVVTTP